MKIGIDMIAAQNGRDSSVGRYTLGLVRRLTTNFPEHKWFIYFHESLGGVAGGWPDDVRVRQLAGEMPNGQAALEQSSDRVDVWLTTAALDAGGEYAPPTAPVSNVHLAGLLFDLAPALLSDRFLPRAAGERYRRGLLTLPRYNLLLTVSEATRRDCLRSFGLAEHRVVAIGPAGSDSRCPEATEDGLPRPSKNERDGLGRPSSEFVLRSLGIVRPFVLCLASDDEDRSVQVLHAAIERLPAELVDRFQFAIVCRLPERRAAAWRGQFARQGFGDRVLLFGAELDAGHDSARCLLHLRCEAAIDASPHEGSGLALLHALECGAATIVDHGSPHSQIAADAALLADVDQPDDLAAKLQQLLGDDALRLRLRARAPVVAGRYSLADAAERAMEALEGLEREEQESGRGDDMASLPLSHSPTPPLSVAQPLAFFSPLLPLRTGIADYSERLLAALKQHYRIDLYHDEGYLPQLGVSSPEFACRDYRMFDRFHRATNYAGAVYQMANTHFCAYVYDMLLRHPGVVVLHDYALPEFHFGYALRAGAPPNFIADEIAFESAALGDEYRSSSEAWRAEKGGAVGACIRRGLSFNRRVLEAAAVVVVHDRWGAEKIGRAHPHLAHKVRVIPHGAAVFAASPDEKRALRRRYGFDANDLILSCFGLLNGAKHHGEAIEALAALRGDFPAARLIFVGGDLNGGREQAKANALGLSDRVRFFGHASMETFLDLMAITDLAMNLRRPPTRGETSGALLTLLGSGTPTIVTDVDAFSSYPDEVVQKIAPLAPGDRSLEHMLRRLLAEPRRRRELGEAAMRHVAEIHDWGRVASLYADAIAGAGGFRYTPPPNKTPTVTV